MSAVATVLLVIKTSIVKYYDKYTNTSITITESGRKRETDTDRFQ